MRHSSTILSSIFVALLASSSFAQQNASLGENAALRYWAAFSEIQDSALTERQAKDLNAVVDGTMPYDDSEFKDLLEKNKPAIEIMDRAVSLGGCDWGLDYGLGPDTPVEYVRRSLVLGRLNALYSLHLLTVGDKDAALHTLAAGLKFSRDVASGGSLFATVVAKHLIVIHLNAISDSLHVEQLSPAQRKDLQQAIAGLGAHGVDWPSAITREMAVLNRPPWQESVSLTRVTQAYVAATNDSSQLSRLEQVMATVPQPLRDVIPNPKEVVGQKQELDQKLQHTRSLLQ